MKLILRNYKHWTHKTFRFKEGISLLYGRSGTGKSTVCQSIKYCLYGRRIRITSKSRIVIKKSTSVTLKFRDFKIIRATKPESITVIYDGIKLQGTEAQNWINEKFGIEDIWCSSSYIEQKNSHFIINATGAKKMELFEQLAFGDENYKPDVYVERVNKKISNIRSKVADLTSQKESLSKAMKQFQKRYKESFLWKNLNIDELKNELKLKQLELNKLQKWYEEATKSEDNIKTLTKILENTVQDINKYQPSTDINYDEKIAEISSQIRYLNIINLINDLEFDSDVLTLDHQEINHNLLLYNNLIESGWNTKTSSDDYIHLNKQQNIDYQKFLDQDEIQRRNIEYGKINDQTVVSYKLQKKQYLKYIEAFEEYLIKEEKRNERMKRLDKIKIQSLDSEDDMGVKFCSLFLDYLKLEEEISTLDFNKEILTLDPNLIRHNSILYRNLISSGWDQVISPKEFIMKQKELNDKYSEYLRHVDTNEKITLRNQASRRMNLRIQKSYDLEYTRYTQYLDQQAKYLLLQQQIKSLDSSDDFSAKHCQRHIKYLRIQDEIKALNFDTQILQLDSNEVNRNNMIFSHLLKCGWDINSSFFEFITSQKEQNHQYLEYQNSVKLNKEIELRNNKYLEINRQATKSYNKELKKYQEYIKIFEEVSKISINVLDKDDDLSVSYCQSHLNYLETKQRIQDLDFDTRVFELDNNEVNRNSILFSQLIKCGWDIDSSFLEFITSQKVQNKQYNEYLNSTQLNEEIEQRNKKYQEINKQTTKTYDKDLRKYQKYQEDEFKLNEIHDKINQIKIVPYDEEDDLSVYYIKTKVKIINELLQELWCPHCHKGCKYSNGEILPGSVSLEERKVLLDKLINLDKEIQKRQTKETLSKNLFENKKYEEPSKPDLIVLEELNVINKVTKPQLEIFEIPTMSYSDTLRYLNSFNNLTTYRNLESTLLKYPKSIHNKLDLTNELKNRILRDKLIQENPKIIEPNIPTLLELEELLVCTKVDKPSLEIYEVPTMSYSVTLIYLRSFDKLSKYQELQELGRKYPSSSHTYQDLDNELQNRLLRDKMFQDKAPLIVDEPEQPQLLEIQELIPTEQVQKPTLNSFEIPSLSYLNTLDYQKSLENLTQYQKLTKLLGSYRISKHTKEFLEGELQNRIEYSNLQDELKEVNNKPEEIIKPVKPQLLPIIELEILKKVDKPKLSIYTLPTFEYTQTLRYSKSINNLKRYQQLSNELSSYKETRLTSKELTKKLERYSKLAQEIRENKIKITQLEEHKVDIKKQLEILHNNDLKSAKEYKKDISKTNNEIAILDLKIKACKDLDYYNDLYGKCQNYEKKLVEKITDVEEWNTLSKTISDVSARYLQEKIDNINGILKSILDELFDEPIEVLISPTKTIKTTQKTKVQINIEILYKGDVYEIRDLSGGEQDRVSLALLLAFSCINDSPFIIIDEAMAAVDAELRTKAINLIKKWADGKIVIHICHEIVKGLHDEVIKMIK